LTKQRIEKLQKTEIDLVNGGDNQIPPGTGIWDDLPWPLGGRPPHYNLDGDEYFGPTLKKEPLFSRLFFCV